MLATIFMLAALAGGEQAAPLTSKPLPPSNIHTIPSGYEPPLPSSITFDVRAQCQRVPFHLTMQSGHETTLAAFAFGGRALSPKQFADLRGWLSELKGQVVPTVLCDTDGVQIFFREAVYAGARGTLATLQVEYVKGELRRVGAPR